MPRLVVCADDYALTPGVSRSIRALLTARRISATSVMAASPYWPDEAAALKAVADDADIGLHLTLTEHIPLGPMPNFAPRGAMPPMPAVHKAGLLRRLPLLEIEAELERQLEQFITYYGAPPAHIDGHHHVQQLPGVRDLVVKAAARFGGRTWVRSCRENPARVWRRGVAKSKALIIGSLGAATEQRARAARVPTNRGFSGAYDFIAEPRSYSDLCRHFIAEAGDNALMMCHPGHADAQLAALDAMTTARDREHDYFLSDGWPAMLVAAGLTLGPLRRP
jgi:chitin disaccharide deacetylase